MEQNVLCALILTLIAGLSTCIGSFISFYVKNYKGRFLPISLGLSAGVMIYVSFVEMYQESIQILSDSFGEKLGPLYSLLALFAGFCIIFAIDKLVPEPENPHSMLDTTDEENLNKVYKKKKMYKVGLLTALAITIHNFPEGIATFASALHDPHLGLGIALAIALHNIPEGIAVSVPVYVATKSRRKALLFSCLSGFSEFIGAVFAFIILGPHLSANMLAIIYSIVSGIMIYISLDELLPTAKKYGKTHDCIIGIVLGMFVMGVSLILLG